jgi:trigger factor
LVGLLQYQFESQGLKVDANRFNTPEIRAEYRPQAEKNVRWRILCEHIANREDLDLTADELDEIYHEVARLARMDVETVKQDYADIVLVQQTKERKLQDKVLKMLEEAAVITEVPPAHESPDQE